MRIKVGRERPLQAGADSSEEGRQAMSNIPHDRAEAFAGMVARRHEMKTGNGRFARLAEDDHAVNRLAHRAETGLEPVDGLRGGPKCEKTARG